MFEGLVTPPSREDGYLLYVSPLKGYKHQVEVVHALSILRKRTGRHLNLVLIGAGEHSYEQRIRHAVSELRLQESVELTGHLPHDEIPRRFPGALAFVFASSCENCPNTLLEAMASGLPTVCSNVAPMPEFAGDSALYFDPANPQSIADAIMPLMDNPALRVQLSQRAQSKVKDRTWDVSFERLMDVLEEACQSVPET
jgi:glycosyltransferase involved in cell wall biosynthesis